MLKKVSKVLFLVVIAILFLLPSAVANSNCKGGSGAIWAVNASGDKNKEYFYPGEDVYLMGANLEASTAYDWSIWEMPGKIVVASGNVITNSNGEFMIYVWTIPNNPASEYRAVIYREGCSGEDFFKNDSFYTSTSIAEFLSLLIPMGIVISFVTMMRR